MDKIDIIGAGFSGLIASKVLEHSYNTTIYESRKAMPDNHKAVLRFRTNNVGRLINKNFKSVVVSKGIICDGSFVSGTIEQNNLYSRKITDAINNDLKLSSMILERSISDISSCIRYICDYTLQEHLSKNSNIKYDVFFKLRFCNGFSTPVISTMPMPILMDMLGYENKPKFEFRQIYIRCYKIKNCNVYQTLYFTSENTDLYRASITKNILILEYMDYKENYRESLSDEHYHSECKEILSYFGIPYENLGDLVSSNTQKIGKLIPIDDKTRKEFVGWATREFNIYSLGRFATWRSIQLDDVVTDGIKIKKAIENKGYFS